DVVSIINPSLIVVGGTLARGGDLLLSGIRELVYQRCLPLTTRNFSIELSTIRDDSALYGAAHLPLDDIFAPTKTGELLARYGAAAASTHPHAPTRATTGT
ncbi:sugar kinase, partial [Sinorhizobium medicae]